VPYQPSQRALDFMRCVVPEQRRYFRVHLPIQACALFRDLREPQNAFLRDINMLGAFFYCKHKPQIGQSAKLEFALPGEIDSMEATCEGRVVRVEESGPEAAVGVAIVFANYNLARPSKTKDAAHQLHTAPFIAWTVQMVERAFEKLSGLARSSSKCEHVI